jgi:parallel beta-helix repeat protein
MTISFWLYVINGVSPDRQNPIDKAYGGDGTITLEPGGYMTLYYGSYGGNDQPYTYDSGPAYTTGIWEHWAIVRDRTGRTTTWYKNGVADAPESYTSTHDPVHSTNALQIGYGYTNPLNGSMDEVMIFNRTLDAAEIKALYDSKSNKFNTSNMTLANGQHNYTVYATDTVGNTASSGWRYFVVTGGSTLNDCGNLVGANTVYYLSNNVSSIGRCFDIAAANITLDCQNNWITFSTGGATNTQGVFSMSRNITIRNCNILDGNWTSSQTWRQGIYLSGSNYSTLYNNTINVSNGQGMVIEGEWYNNITKNRVRSNSSSSYGIFINGYNKYSNLDTLHPFLLYLFVI